MFEISAFRRVPRFAQGQVRDLRPRWALEEAGAPYAIRFVSADDQAEGSDYRTMQPFGQVPALRDGALTLFETGAILLHLADRFPALLPERTDDRMRAIMWMLAAANTLEPALMNVAEVDFFIADVELKSRRRPGVMRFAERRLGEVETALGAREWLAPVFSIADIMLATVLRIVGHTDMLSRFPGLAAYRSRCETRPAFERALSAQLRDLGVPAEAMAAG